MGFDDEFAEGVEFVKNLSFDSNWDGSTFETTIRYLGGLLSAHELSGEKVLRSPRSLSLLSDSLFLVDSLAQSERTGRSHAPWCATFLFAATGPVELTPPEAFETRTGIPYATINLHTGRAYSPSFVLPPRCFFGPR